MRALVFAIAMLATGCNAVLGIGTRSLGDDAGVSTDAAISDGPIGDAARDAALDASIDARIDAGVDAPIDAGVDAAPGPLSLSGGMTTLGPEGTTSGTIRLVDTRLEGAATECSGTGAARICLTGGLTP